MLSVGVCRSPVLSAKHWLPHPPSSPTAPRLAFCSRASMRQAQGLKPSVFSGSATTQINNHISSNVHRLIKILRRRDPGYIAPHITSVQSDGQLAQECHEAEVCLMLVRRRILAHYPLVAASAPEYDICLPAILQRPRALFQSSYPFPMQDSYLRPSPPHSLATFQCSLSYRLILCRVCTPYFCIQYLTHWPPPTHPTGPCS